MIPHSTPLAAPPYVGLRMTADAFFAIPDDGFRYELVDGIVVMNASPTPLHQMVAMELSRQLATYFRAHPVARVLAETDVRFSDTLVYRPDLVVIRRERLADPREGLRMAPDLIVEILSPWSRRYDHVTKRRDYALHGVAEYWILDPDHRQHEFLRLVDRDYIATPVGANRAESSGFPGLHLDLESLERSLEP